MKAVLCLLVMLSGHQVVMGQKDVIECYNQYNDQQAKLTSIRDEREKHRIDCEAQKVQVDCLDRVYDNSVKDLKPCVELKVNEAKKLFLAECDACRRSSWPLLVLLPILLTTLVGYLSAPT